MAEVSEHEQLYVEITKLAERQVADRKDISLHEDRIAALEEYLSSGQAGSRNVKFGEWLVAAGMLGATAVWLLQFGINPVEDKVEKEILNRKAADARIERQLKEDMKDSEKWLLRFSKERLEERKREMELLHRKREKEK